MSLRKPEPGSPADWLARAKGHLVMARQAKPEGTFWEDYCFNAQQAAEQAVKAVLRQHRVRFPATHALGVLLDLIPPDLPVPVTVREAAKLSDYALVAQSPGDYPPVTEGDYREAVDLAQNVVAWAERFVDLAEEMDGLPHDGTHSTPP